MTPEQKEKILKRADEHGSKNINPGLYPGPFSISSGGVNSLGHVVLTKEKAELFMKMLEWEKEKGTTK